MRAAVLSRGEVVVRDQVDDPVPQAGQALVQVRACGICGSDVHFARHGTSVVARSKEVVGSPLSDAGFLADIDLDRDVFLGHEFVAEVLDFGPGTTSAIRPGAMVTAFPLLIGPAGPASILWSNTTKAGYCERMLLTSDLLIEVPNGLRPEVAALTEPMAVGLHAVNRARVQPDEGALVLGCGPVGLAVIAALERKSVGPIVVADYSPARRSLALTMGATDAVDPREESAWAAWARLRNGRQAVVFDAVGLPGVINEMLRMAPNGSRIVVVGMCMEDDTINPFFGISKELQVQFTLGYDPSEFAESLRAIAEGDVDAAALVTAEVGLDRVAWAFEALGNPEEHCKIIVTPT